MIIIIKTILVRFFGYIGRYSKFDKSVNFAKVLQPMAFITWLMICFHWKKAKKASKT